MADWRMPVALGELAIWSDANALKRASSGPGTKAFRTLQAVRLAFFIARQSEGSLHNLDFLDPPRKPACGRSPGRVPLTPLPFRSHL